MATYPALQALLVDLRQLQNESILDAIAPPRAGPTMQEGRDVSRVSWPGIGEFWLTPPQREVVRVLLAALLESRNPDVDQRALLQAAGSRKRALAELFADSPAWGVLVIRGARAGTYRLPPIPEGESEV